MKKAIITLITILACMVPQAVLASDNAAAHKATDKTFYATIYGKTERLSIKSVNAIEQTSEGRIWIGSYDGLYSYDGVNYEKQPLPGEINSITALLADAYDNLWIGTNDFGLFYYNPKTREVTDFLTEDDKNLGYIHSIAEGDESSVYVGCVEDVYHIYSDGTIEKLENLAGLLSPDGLGYDSKNKILYGVTNSGVLFSANDGGIIYSADSTGVGTEIFTAVTVTNAGNIIVGTDSGALLKAETEKGVPEKFKRFSATKYGNIYRINYDEKSSSWIVCGVNGCGVIDENGKVKDFTSESFNSSINDCLVDYQNNYWYVSDSQGVCKMSEDMFYDIFEAKNIERSNINAITSFNGDIYIVTDSGLTVLNEQTLEEADYSFIDNFRDVRIRHIFRDSKNRIWLSTYGEYGFTCIDSDYRMTVYNEASGIVGAKGRLAIELADGTIAASTSSALNFIQDGKVVKTIDKAGGIKSQILTMYVDEDGLLYAGSDGDGIYIIRDQEITDTISEDNGLNSKVILRIVECDKGLIYVTSNGLYFDDGTKEIVKLTEFPGSNNFDMYIKKDGTAWVSNGTGIIVANLDDIIANEPGYNYTMLNEFYGLKDNLTAISWNYADENENIYLCTVNGVLKTSTDLEQLAILDYEIGISKIVGDDDEVISPVDREYTVKKNVKRITISPAMYNYRLNNPLVHVYLEGFDDIGINAYQTELSEISYTNLTYGTHNLHIQILDENTGEVLKEEIFKITRDAHIWEYLWFNVILGIIAMVLVSAITIYIVHKVNAERLRREKERILTFLSYNDELTGALNRHALDERTDAFGMERTLGVIFGDIMSLKKVNDTMGHEAGDALILRAYSVMKEIAGEKNVYRTGGDEFVILLEDMSKEDVEKLVSKLSEKLKANDSETALGYAWTDSYAGNYAELQRIADELMYEDKKKRYRATGYVRGHV